MDAFFAAVEVADNPALAGLPLIVGAIPGTRGVVSTCSYEARRYGVHSAMPISEAVRRCPVAQFLPVRMSRYTAVSASIMDILGTFTPEMIRVSIDEASLDMSGTQRLWGSPDVAARAIKERIRESTGLTISIGVAANRYIAKIAAGYRKPDGLVIVAAGDEASFMEKLAIKDLWGVGSKTRERLQELAIHSISDLKAISENMLLSLFGTAAGSFLFKACRGIDPGMYSQSPKSRSMSTETTFELDVCDAETIDAVLLEMAMQLSLRMYEAGVSAHTAVLKLRYADFETVSIRESFSGPFTSSDAIHSAARDLLAKKWNRKPLRLIGLGLSGLGEQDGQGLLFDSGDCRIAKVERAVFEAGRRGLGSITKARLIGNVKRCAPHHE
jgi:DNA polymerase-4